jgi:hypothetical protein
LIFYRPTDGDPYTGRIEYRPKTYFVMTKLGRTLPEEVKNIRSLLVKVLDNSNINIIDADDIVTGKDFLLKIWHILLEVPLGIAIITKDMSNQTFANIFYEIGFMQAYGKETLIIKTEDTLIPSDFIRTEYIEFGIDFEKMMGKYLETFFSLPEYYHSVADQLEKNPLLAIDYLKRAWLISGENSFQQKAKEIFQEACIEGRAKNSVEMLLADFCLA